MMSREELREKYDRMARWYDWAVGLPEIIGVRKLRRALFGRARGKVLEVAAGTGKNLPFYPGGCDITAVDMSPAMLEIARARAKRLDLKVAFATMDAERLEFPDRSFDTVVSSLSTCTIPDPVAALREMARVCRTNGRILLLEHGRSSREWLARWQDRRAPRHAEMLGCQWNREPLDLVRQSGLRLISNRRIFFGVLHTIEAAPVK
jgi:ubiquinone/menaquinone biosynthesis C-methylase UbiE